MKKGLLVFVYRWGLQSCTNGITSKKDQLLLVDESICAPFPVENDEVYLVLIRRTIGGQNYVHAEERLNGKPLHSNEEGTYMAGGNFIYTSDSRFPNQYPISVHDRFEDWKTYEALSR